MKYETHPNLRSKPALGVAAILALLACVFVADTITDHEIAVAVFYIVVIFIAIGLLPIRGVVILAGACVGLTLISFFLTPTGSRETGLINCGISVAAISITTYLALKRLAAETAAYEARAQLVRIARLTSLGALTASIAHEVNQPLAAVVTSGNACRRWLDLDPPNLDKARRAVDRIVSDANRASDVIARVRGLARNETPHKERLSLNDVIAEAIALARTEIDRNGIVLRVSLADNLPPVLADKIQIQQVIGNLLLNAVEAMTKVPRHQRDLEVSSFGENADRVVFAIADSGVGLQPAALEHLFDAFWTTKEGGMGIGLTISRSIIEAHGGRIWATPKPNLGAAFQFSLPVAFGKVR